MKNLTSNHCILTKWYQLFKEFLKERKNKRTWQTYLQIIVYLPNNISYLYPERNKHKEKNFSYLPFNYCILTKWYQLFKEYMKERNNKRTWQPYLQIIVYLPSDINFYRLPEISKQKEKIFTYLPSNYCIFTELSDISFLKNTWKKEATKELDKPTFKSLYTYQVISAF